MIKENVKLSVTHEHEIYSEIKGIPEHVYILLHGYLLDGSYILETLKDSIPINSLIIAPNGPFLVPVKKKEEFVAKYAWYFFDPLKKNYYINFDPAAQFLKDILQKYNSKKLPVTVIGYSQGGYLAPKVAEIVPEVSSVIGLACSFRSNRFKMRSEVNYHQINSKDDLIVDFEGSLEEFNKLEAKGNQGNFITISEVGHRLNSVYLDSLKTILK